MIYDVRHQTIYAYSRPVGFSHCALRLLARSEPGQRLISSELAIEWAGDRPAAALHVLGQEGQGTALVHPRIEPSRHVELPAEQGKWRFWHDNGVNRSEGCFRAGVRVGLWVEWTAEGQPAASTRFDDSECD